jgi:hypothetical protein
MLSGGRQAATIGPLLRPLRPSSLRWGKRHEDQNDGAVYAWVQGTSMASPHAAAVAALIRAAHPNMPVGAVPAILQNTAMPKDCPAPAEMDPLSGALGVQTCSGGPGYTNFYGKGFGRCPGSRWRVGRRQPPNGLAYAGPFARGETAGIVDDEIQVCRDGNRTDHSARHAVTMRARGRAAPQRWL